MSRQIQVRFCESWAVRSRPATHLAVRCTSREQAEQVKARLVQWLAPKGLGFNENKNERELAAADVVVEHIDAVARRPHQALGERWVAVVQPRRPHPRSRTA